MSRHLDPAWGAETVGISEGSEIRYKDRRGEHFTIEEVGGAVQRADRPAPEKGDAGRLKAAREAASALSDAAAKAKVEVSTILALREDEGL